MPPKNVIITLYPLTTADLTRVSEQIDGPVQHLVLSNITAKSYWKIIRKLRALKADHLYFPITGTNDRSLLPLFKVLGMISGSRNNYIVDQEFSIRPLSSSSGFYGLMEILFGISLNTLLLIKEYFRLLRLLNTPRLKIFKKHPGRILFLKNTLWLGLQAGGAIAHTRGVIKGFLSKGRNIDLFSMDGRLPISEIEGFRAVEAKSSHPYIIPRELNFGNFNREVFDALRTEPLSLYEAVYQRLSPGNFSGVSVSRIRKIPLIIEYNGSETWLAKNWGGGLALPHFVRWAELVCLKHAHLVVAVSDVLKDELIDRGIEPDRIVSYPNGVDPEEFNSEQFTDSEISDIRDELGVPNSALLLTFVGTFGHWHGVEFLAKTMTDLAAANAEWFEERNVYFCFIGDGVKRNSVEEMIKNCPLKDRFKITGMISQDKMPIFLAASDILMSPHVPNPDGSPFFGSPTKLFEYMASARPIIASDLYQIARVLEGAPHPHQFPDTGSLPTDEQCGVLVEPNSEKDIVLAIDFLAKNPQWRRSAGINARKRVLSKYTWKRHVEEIYNGFTKAIEYQQEVKDQRPTRVLLNGLHAKTGGGVTYLRNILPLIASSSEFELHLCIHEDQRDILPEMDGRVQLHVFTFKSGFWRLPIWEQIEVPRLAKKIGADVTFSPANYGPIFAPNPVIMLRNALGVAFVERRPIKIAYWLLVSIGTFLSMVTCSRGIAVSSYARNSNFGKITGFLQNRFSIVPHGVSKVFSTAASSSREDYILAVSDTYVQKNLKNLLYAISVLKLKNPAITLKIAGRFVDESYHQDLKRIISDYGLQENVELLGGVHEEVLVDLYHRCAVFVFPSTVETFGNPLIEAMASGAPIASSKTAAMPEIAGEAALYFDPYDVDDIASCIGRLLSEKELRLELSQKALARSKNYSWEKTAESTLDVLYQAVPEVSE